MTWIRLATIALLLCACAPAPRSALVLATTTSVRDSGLLDALLPRFESESGIQVKVIAVGSGQALELGRRGDADVLLVHSPAAEQRFMRRGFGDSRHLVMYNDFVLVGPVSDPAAIRDVTSPIDALLRIANRRIRFVSRGDESGTHAKERELWQRATITTDGDWYVEAGSGMAAVLRMASEVQGYCLSDRATFLAQGDAIDLDILLEGDSVLHNLYSVITVSKARLQGIRRQAAQSFVEFLRAPETRSIIAHFGKERFGQALFIPVADH